jgi:mannan endo-1,4-beta-mannosidase
VLSGLLFCSMLLAFGAPVPSAVAATSGFVTAHGTELQVNGQPWKFAGYNLPCANPFALSDGALGVYLNDVQQVSGANAIRVWFFQSQGGPGNWTNFDRVISALKSRGMRAIVTLSNETSTCDEPSATSFYKTLSWYTSGYMSAEGGYDLSFHDYAVAVAAHYANEPTVAFWQLINEAQAPSEVGSGPATCPDDLAARDGLKSFSDSMAQAIHNVDRNHLVDLGTLSTGACGIMNDADYTDVHAGALGLCEYHDYGSPAAAMPAALNGIVNDCRRLGKPVYIGESGIPSNVGPKGMPSSTCNPWPDCIPQDEPITFDTLNQRATFFQAKIQAANQAGIAGYVIWVKSPFYSATTDGYAISDNDPVEGVLSQALQPYPKSPGPPAATPEVPWAPGLVLLALALCGAGIVITQRRRPTPG